MFHFLEGTDWIVVDDERIAINASSIVTTSPGANRGIEAETWLAFLAVRAPI